MACGECVAACPTGALSNATGAHQIEADRKVDSVCPYCGVGCSFRADMQGDKVIRMVPDKNGKANQGHSCVKGRFAFGYATHQDRITSPMIRDNIEQDWREVSWDEALAFAAKRLTDIQEEHGRNSIGAITSSRCTNEETYLVQKLVRAVFQNNNVDTCARVCHSPTPSPVSYTHLTLPTIYSV